METQETISGRNDNRSFKMSDVEMGNTADARYPTKAGRSISTSGSSYQNISGESDSPMRSGVTFPKTGRDMNNNYGVLRENNSSLPEMASPVSPHEQRPALSLYNLRVWSERENGSKIRRQSSSENESSVRSRRSSDLSSVASNGSKTGSAGRGLTSATKADAYPEVDRLWALRRSCPDDPILRKLLGTEMSLNIQHQGSQLQETGSRTYSSMTIFPVRTRPNKTGKRIAGKTGNGFSFGRQSASSKSGSSFEVIVNCGICGLPKKPFPVEKMDGSRQHDDTGVAATMQDYAKTGSEGTCTMKSPPLVENSTTDVTDDGDERKYQSMSFFMRNAAWRRFPYY